MKHVARILLTVAMLLLAAQLPARTFTIVIDPGHGGKDYGAIGAITNEKTINLDVSKLLADKIRNSGADVKVVMTRDNDVFIPLQNRAKIANNAKGDLFISIHVNSVDKKNRNRQNIRGAEIYTLGLHKSDENLAVAQRENAVISLEGDNTEVYKEFDPTSVESLIAFELAQSGNLELSISFAAEAQRRLIDQAGRADRGVRQAGFWVLWASAMPSVLVELDFISNPTSEKYLASADGKEQLATALYDAFMHYYNSVNVVAPEKPQQPTAPEKKENKKSDKKDSKAPVPETKPVQQPAESSWRNGVASQETSEPAIAPEFVPEVAPESAVSAEEYRIQILTSPTELRKGDPKFKGHTAVDQYFEKNLYKYTVGHFATEEQANKALPKYRNYFRDAFVIKMRDGQRVYD